MRTASHSASPRATWSALTCSLCSTSPHCGRLVHVGWWVRGERGSSLLQQGHCCCRSGSGENSAHLQHACLHSHQPALGGGAEQRDAGAVWLQHSISLGPLVPVAQEAGDVHAACQTERKKSQRAIGLAACPSPHLAPSCFRRSREVCCAPMASRPPNRNRPPAPSGAMTCPPARATGLPPLLPTLSARHSWGGQGVCKGEAKADSTKCSTFTRSQARATTALPAHHTV